MIRVKAVFALGERASPRTRTGRAASLVTHRFFHDLRERAVPIVREASACWQHTVAIGRRAPPPAGW